MAEISKITLPSGTTYDIKDATAREAIASLSSYTKYGGVTTTPLSDGSTTNPIQINGESVDAVTGLIATYQNKEFIWNGSAWQEFGDLSGLGELAYVNSATGSYTPAGSVSLTNTNKTATVSPAGSGTATYTPSGSITGGTFTGESMTSTGSFTPSGSVSFTSTSNKTATVSPAGSGTVTYTPAGTITGGAFTGSSMTSTGSFTPSGSVSLTNSSVTTTVSKASSGTATYTPEGTVTAPNISVATAGTTTTVHNPTKQTVATAVRATAPGATSPSNAITYYSVSNETLSLYQIGYDTGDSITTSDVTVKTGDASYSASTPTFSGTGARLVTGSISVPNSAEFSGESGTVSVSGTTTGSVSAIGFSGTGVRLVTGNIAVPSAAEFTGESGSVSVTGTPSGSISELGFSGTGVRLVTDNIAVPTGANFTGTAATITVEAGE